jgi:hypothetical protein
MKLRSSATVALVGGGSDFQACCLVGALKEQAWVGVEAAD